MGRFCLLVVSTFAYACDEPGQSVGHAKTAQGDPEICSVDAPGDGYPPGHARLAPTEDGGFFVAKSGVVGTSWVNLVRVGPDGKVLQSQDPEGSSIHYRNHIDVAVLPNGQMVAAYGYDDHGIYATSMVARRYTDPTFQDDQSVIVAESEALSLQTPPDIEGFGEEGFIVAWQDSGGIHASTRPQLGPGHVNHDLRLDEEINAWRSAPSVAALSDGNAVVVWTEDAINTDYPEYDLMVQRVDASEGGTLDGDPIRIGRGNSPEVEGLDQGRYLVKWTFSCGDYSNVGPYSVHLGAFEGDGTPAADAVEVVDCAAWASQVATWPDGRSVVVWQQQDGAFAQRFSSELEPMGDPVSLGPVPEHPYGEETLPDVATMPDGGIVVLWHGDAFSRFDEELRPVSVDGSALACEGVSPD